MNETAFEDISDRLESFQEKIREASQDLLFKGASKDLREAVGRNDGNDKAFERLKVKNEAQLTQLANFESLGCAWNN